MAFAFTAPTLAGIIVPPVTEAVKVTRRAGVIAKSAAGGVIQSRPATGGTLSADHARSLSVKNEEER
jgi:hypothetical protein